MVTYRKVVSLQPLLGSDGRPYRGDTANLCRVGGKTVRSRTNAPGWVGLHRCRALSDMSLLCV